MVDSRQERCFFCGATFPRRELFRGSGGSICRACIGALRELCDAPPPTDSGPRATEQATRAVSLEEIRRERGEPREAATAPAADVAELQDHRIGDHTALVDTMEGTDDNEIDLDRSIRREFSAHDYESRMDLAAAYIEMGRRHAAVRELLSALESTLLCKDYPAALRCIARARATVDVAKVRDRICEILARHAPSE